MANRGKPNATGRSSGKIGGKRGEMLRVPKGEPWVWYTAEMIASDAMRSLGINGRRVLDFLVLEHLRHGATENGNLYAPYRHLEAFGISSRLVNQAIGEVESAGFIAADRPGMREATRYRLTWLPSKEWEPASNEWRSFRNQKSTRRSEGRLPSEVRAEDANLPSEVQADPALTCEGAIYILEGEAA